MDKGEEQDNPTLFEIMKDDPDITYNEATKVQEDLRLKKEGVCITGALKKDLRKGIGMNSPEMEEAKRTIKNLEVRLAEILQINESHHKLNGKLQTRVTDLEEDNKKLAHQIENNLNRIRKAGM